MKSCKMKKRCTIKCFWLFLIPWLSIIFLACPALAAWVAVPGTDVSVNKGLPSVDPNTGETSIVVTLINIDNNTEEDDSIIGDFRLLVIPEDGITFPIYTTGIMGEGGSNPTPYYELTTATGGVLLEGEEITITVVFADIVPVYTLTLEANEESASRDIFRKNVSKAPEIPTTTGLIKVMPVYVDAQNTKGQKLCINVAAEDSKSALIPCTEVVCLDENGEPIPCSTDPVPARVKPLVMSYDQEVEGTEFNSVPDWEGEGTRLVRDIYTAFSLDDGATWKRKNISRTATKSSFTLANGVQYPGDSEKPNITIAGPYVLVTWVDKYCRSGNPWDMLDADDIYQVMGSQRSADYLDVHGDDEPRPDLGERPFSCVMAARGVLEQNVEIKIVDNSDPENPTTSTIDNPNFGTITWYKAEQLSVGRRDAYQNFTASYQPVFDDDQARSGTGGFAVSWQEDPKGLKTGKGRGPGAGMSGSCVNHKTDIWYSYIGWDDFADIDPDFVPSEGGDDGDPTPEGDSGGYSIYICTCGHVYDPYDEENLDDEGNPVKFTDLPEEWVCPADGCGAPTTEFEKITKPHALYSMAPPVRVTDNAVCKDRTPEDILGHLHDPAIEEGPAADCTFTYEGGTTRQSTHWADLPDDWMCPQCGEGQETFVEGIIKTKHVGLPFCAEYVSNPRVDKDGKYVDPGDPAYDYANYCLHGEWVAADTPSTVLSSDPAAATITDGLAYIGGTQVVWTGEPLDGNTGASRANIAVTNWDGQTMLVMAYEETKGEGAGSSEKVTKAPEQLAPVPLEVLAVDSSGTITDYLGAFNNGDCVSCHYNHVVPRNRIIPIFDPSACSSMDATWDEMVTGYWPYELDESGNVTSVGSETKCVKFYKGRGMYSRDAAVVDDGYYALPTHLPGWHQPTLDCIGCHVAFGTKDLDNDGVADMNDLCLGTSVDAEVDEFGCSADQDPADVGQSDHEKRDRQGKNMVYQYFPFDAPETIGHGYLVNVPNSLGNYENARRVRVVPGSIYDSQTPGEEITLGLFYKQGLGGQGAPADAMLQLFKGGLSPDHIVRNEDGVTPKVWNTSSSTPLAYKPLPLEFLLCDASDPPVCVPTDTDTGVLNPDYDVDNKGHKTPKVEEFVWTAANLSDETGWKLPLIGDDGKIVLDADGYPVIDENEFGIPEVLANPYENVFSTRLDIRGNFILTGFAHCVNWAAGKKAHDHYDYYVRWSEDGGVTWTLPVNVSELKNHKETTSDPRILLPPVTIGKWGTDENGVPTYEKDNVEAQDVFNPNMFFVAIGTQTNFPEPKIKDLEIKEAEEFLDVTFTRAVKNALNGGTFEFEKVTKDNPKYPGYPCLDPDTLQSNGDPTPVWPNDYTPDDYPEVVVPDCIDDGYEDNPDFPEPETVEEFDWLAKGDATQGDVQITSSPNASKLYGIYEQVLPIDEESGQSHFQGFDIWMRKVTYEKVPGDTDGDLVVNMEDYSVLASAFDTCQGDPSSNMNTDLNGDKCTTVADSAVWTNLYLLDSVDTENFKSKKMKKVFTKKLNKVLKLIKRGKYRAATAKLKRDIINKTNGCHDIGYPDDNDWLTDCQSQNKFYQFGVTTIEMINN